MANYDEATPTNPGSRPRIIPCASAQQFLENIQPWQSWFSETRGWKDWVFRGEGNNSWDLIPSAWREDGIQKLREMTPTYVVDESGNSDDAVDDLERDAVKSFLEASDRIALPLPGDSLELREALARSNAPGAVWPPDAALPLIALAQHSGLPTQMLDWSYDARVAGYFAAAGGAKGSNTASHVVLWALNREAFEFDYWIRTVLHKEGPAPHPRIRFVTVPAASNRNLAAQKGLFTRMNFPGYLRDSGLEHLAREHLHLASQIAHMRELESFVTTDPPRDLLLRLTLPRAEAPKLLRLLALQGVDRSSVEPSYEGVGKSLAERQLWDIPHATPTATMITTADEPED